MEKTTRKQDLSPRGLKKYTHYFRLPKGNKWATLFVLISYIFFTAYYMGPSTWNCTTTTYGFGDNTAGPIWKYGIEPDQKPLGSFSYVTNYPAGEDLYSPVNYSLSGQSYIIWGLSKVAGPICGYNLFNVAGFILSALAMYGFILALTRNRWIAWLAGYAVAFTPYYQMKVGGHPGYGFQALLILVAWLFFNLMKNQRKRDVALFGSAVAFCFYFDPYFSVLAFSIVAPLIVTWFGLSLWRIKRARDYTKVFKKQFNVLIASMFTILALLVPLLGVAISSGEEINQSVASNRGNVLFEAKACSNLPHEYLLPFVLNPVLSGIVGANRYAGYIDKLADNFSCGIGEDSVGLSLAIVATVSIGMVIIAWELLNRRRIKLKLTFDAQLIIFGLIAIGIFAVALALPPVKFKGIPTPSYLMLDITTTWRTISRFYMLVNFAAVSLMSIVMLFIYTNLRKRRYLMRVLFLLLLFIIAVEYQAFTPFAGNKLSTFDYSKDVPSVYTWLKDQEEIDEIAEYPLERSGGESNAMAYYLTMQAIHKKKLFNGNVTDTNEEKLRNSLKDISDPQTIAVLGSIGVDAVVIHGLEEKEVRRIPGLEVLYVAPQAKFNMISYTPLVKNDITIVAAVRPQKRVDSMMSLGDGFVRNTNIIKSSLDWSYEATNNSIIKVSGLPGGNRDRDLSTEKYCFSVRISDDNALSTLYIKVDGGTRRELPISSAYQDIVVDAKEKIEISNSTGFNMRIKDLGCSDLVVR